MSLNPFATSIDLSTSDGNKFYTAAAKGIDGKKIELQKSDTTRMVSAIQEAKGKFAWGNALGKLPFVLDHADATLRPDVKYDIMKDYAKIMIDKAVMAGGHRFDSNFELRHVIAACNKHDFSVMMLDLDHDLDQNTLDKHQMRLKLTMMATWFMNSLSKKAQAKLN